MPGQLLSRLGRLEGQARLLALVKLANVALAVLWGFAVTFVFVRLLPLGEFKAFLLLVAFANFTISADFGFSGIIYARLRRFRLGEGEVADGFRPAEIGMLFTFMLLVVLLGGLAISACLATGLIPTERPALFMVFYALSALNIIALLAKRALAALDHNMLWEVMDFGRRFLSVMLLLAALAGLPILLSVFAQIGLTVAVLFAGLATVHGAIGMSAGQWFPLRSARLLRGYVRDMGATMLLTMSDVAAYNAPYLGIALMTRDPRPLLVFDFLFKMSRALSAAIRALVEAGLPRITRAYHAGQHEAARAAIDRLRMLALGGAAALGVLLLVAGPQISRVMFDGKVVLGRDELLLMAVLLGGLAMMCVSTYVHNGLGRFGILLPPSLVFLAGSVASVAIAGAATAAFSMYFLAAYALVHVLLGVRHDGMMRGLARP